MINSTASKNQNSRVHSICSLKNIVALSVSDVGKALDTGNSNMTSKCIRKRLELPVSSTFSNVLPHYKFGLNIILPST